MLTTGVLERYEKKLQSHYRGDNNTGQVQQLNGGPLSVFE